MMDLAGQDQVKTVRLHIKPMVVYLVRASAFVEENDLEIFFVTVRISGFNDFLHPPNPEKLFGVEFVFYRNLHAGIAMF
jgi:hypothetical protein